MKPIWNIKTLAVCAAVSMLVVLPLSTPATLVAQQPRASRANVSFPKACFFFKADAFNDAQNRASPKEERVYSASADRVYRLWCSPNVTTKQQRIDAADAMVVAWQQLWDRDEPFNAHFHETGSLDLLALLGVTHELPVLMRTDARFTNVWIENCSYVCFHLDYAPGNAASGRFTLMQLWLRNDVLDNLKNEPASVPISKMLADAKFTLVD